MNVISVTNDCIFIGCDKNLNQKTQNKHVVFIDPFIYDVVSRELTPKYEIIQKLLNDKTLGKGTIRYWEENWHDRLVKEIVDLYHFDATDVSNSIWAFLKY